MTFDEWFWSWTFRDLKIFNEWVRYNERERKEDEK
jgi:hypothetical protein